MRARISGRPICTSVFLPQAGEHPPGAGGMTAGVDVRPTPTIRELRMDKRDSAKGRHWAWPGVCWCGMSHQARGPPLDESRDGETALGPDVVSGPERPGRLPRSRVPRLTIKATTGRREAGPSGRTHPGGAPDRENPQTFLPEAAPVEDSLASATTPGMKRLCRGSARTKGTNWVSYWSVPQQRQQE